MKKLTNFQLERIVREHGVTGDYEINVFSASEEEMKSCGTGKHTMC